MTDHISREIFSGHGWKIFMETSDMPNGRTKTSARVHRCDSVHIIAMPTAKTVLMNKEYRPHFRTHLWMLPSGKVDKEMDHKQAALRELQEETGKAARELSHYCTVRHSENLVMNNHVYVARDLYSDPLPQDKDEMIEVFELPFEEALQNVLSSPHVHMASAFALLRYMREHGL